MVLICFDGNSLLFFNGWWTGVPHDITVWWSPKVGIYHWTCGCDMLKLMGTLISRCPQRMEIICSQTQSRNSCQCQACQAVRLHRHSKWSKHLEMVWKSGGPIVSTWEFLEIVVPGIPLFIIHKNRVFHHILHPFLGIPIYGNLHGYRSETAHVRDL